MSKVTFAARSPTRHLCKHALSQNTRRQTSTDRYHSGLIGFVVGLTPLACTLMGWRGTSIGPNTGAANMYVVD
jgi:hypothetical protein